MPTALKIPIPQSAMMYDPATGRPSREWYQYWENIGVNVAPVASLPLGKIWIGNAGSVPIAQTFTGDVTVTSVGVTQLQDTANVTTIVESIIAESTGSILANQVFGY